MSAQQQTLDGEIADSTEERPHYRQQYNQEGQIMWEVGRDCNFDDVRDELAEVHRRWVDAGLSDDPEAGAK
ncbi:hypothetical protein ACOJIV_20645 [Haloarcula sp. AONF1]